MRGLTADQRHLGKTIPLGLGRAPRGLGEASYEGQSEESVCRDGRRFHLKHVHTLL